ncbi:hypothetical protein BgAZ_205790 [Babesia gibsoni]|uniref:Uncharacterized protein n=1 Tax=Babesia gibsoni TaxID=33632 RepID=A0AAD8PDQ4_BABGI|nr:hypothetical protein BgAZ_205790 [Babesia gibsoni]
MVAAGKAVLLEELKASIAEAYPGIEQQLGEIFAEHDIAGDGTLPYTVVEPLLRHFFHVCGLTEYVAALTDEAGKLDVAAVGPLLVGTTLEGAKDLGEERLVTPEEMFTLAVVWLKVISDVYKKEDGAPAPPSTLSAAFCCKGTDYVQPDGAEGGEVVEGQVIVEAEPGVVIGPDGIILDDAPHYIEHINDEAEEEELKKKNVENYIQTLVNEAAANKKQGVTCYVYPTGATVNGSCVSAGAAVPHRRPPRPKEQKKPAPGCC